VSSLSSLLMTLPAAAPEGNTCNCEYGYVKVLERLGCKWRNFEVLNCDGSLLVV